MAKVLYIQASATKDRSKSIEVSDAFVEAYKKANPSDTVETVNIFDIDLPEFNAMMAQAKYRILHGQDHTAEEKEAWGKVEKAIEHFKSADKYVFAIPMWNFGIPWRLKQYIDIIVQPGYTFAVNEQGSQGLLIDKSVVAIYARGGQYGPGTGGEALDMQSNYFEMVLGFMGITQVHTVFVEPTMVDKETVEKAIAEAKQKAVELAGRF